MIRLLRSPCYRTGLQNPSSNVLVGSIRGHAGKLLEAVADEKRLHFNDELRRHCRFALVFDLKEAGP